VNERKSKQIIHFDHHYQSIQKRLLASGYSRTAILRAASDARNSIGETIEIIAKQCRRPSSRQTRRNGFEALVKIGKAIVTSDRRNTLGYEVRREFGDDDTLEDGILEIFKQMDLGEKADIRRPSTDLWRTMEELKRYASRFWGDKLYDMFNYLEGRVDDEEDEEEEEEEDDDEEGEEEDEEEEEEEEEEE